MPQYRRIGRAFTEVRYTDRAGNTRSRSQGGEEIHVLYHGKHTACWNDFQICLRNNGHWTMTTKVRMNQAANQFSLGFQVYQRTNRRTHERKWYVKWRGHELVFNNGIILNRRETVQSMPGRSPVSIPRLQEFVNAQQRALQTSIFGAAPTPEEYQDPPF